MSLSGVDFSDKSLKLDTESDAAPIIEAINGCKNLQFLALKGNTLGVEAAKAIAKALEKHPEFKIARFSDLFTGRLKTEIPPALSALGDGMIAAGTRLSILDLSDNAFGPIGVEGLAKLLQSDVCSELQELRLNNNGLGITGGRLLASALSARPRKLKVFIAGRNRLENEGAKALAKVFQQMGTLEEVAMPQNGIYHEGISALSEAFKCNKCLKTLNLNDNTIGPKGAQALAEALPQLTNLKSINFGDCLLKSKGAKTLAQGFKASSTLLESLDVSHNEIGRDACMELVDAISILPDSANRLTKVILAGNSLGGSANKNIMKLKLGSSAVLSDGEDSGEEDEESNEEESDEDEDDDEDSEDEEDNDDTIVQLTNAMKLDHSGSEQVHGDVAKFLEEPSLHNLIMLGPNVVDVIDAHIQTTKSNDELIQAYVQVALLISSLAEDEGAWRVAESFYNLLMQRARERPTKEWVLADAFLTGLSLIKAEKKEQAKPALNLDSCLRVLGKMVLDENFPISLRDTLRFFLARQLSPAKRDELPPGLQQQ